MTERLNILYSRLLDRYGDPRWWPAGSVYEVMIGAVLTVVGTGLILSR